MSARFPLLATLAILLVGCPPVEVTPTSEPTPTEPTTIDSDIVGDWLSEGEDLAPLFVTLTYDTVEATFNEDASYEVLLTDQAGSQTTFLGTYSVDESTSPATIVLNQTTPQELTSEGIFEIVDGVMTYEVAQTSPDLGITPANPTDGFGSTTSPSLSPGDLVQTYR